MSNQQYSRDTENIHKHLLAKPIAKKNAVLIYNKQMYYLQLIPNANPLDARNRKSVPSHNKK